MFTISILMPDTFQVQVPVSVPQKWKKGLQAQNNPPPLPKKNVVLFPLQRPHSPKKVTCELSLLLLSPPCLRASSPGFPGYGGGRGRRGKRVCTRISQNWISVPAGELACRLTGETPLLAWNLSNLSPFLPHRHIAPWEMLTGYSPPCFERFFSEWVSTLQCYQ